MQEHNWKSKTVWLPSSRPPCLSSPHHLKCHTHKQTALRADCLFFRYTMLSIYTKGLKWASIEDRISAQATHHSASQSHICMINTSNNINSPSSSTCQWARTHTHMHTHPIQANSYTRRCIHPSYADTRTHTMYPNPYRAAHEHTDTAPSIMVNTSNSTSFLDSWSLDRHGSDSPWFLAGCLPLQLPHFLYSLWSLFGWLQNMLPK